MNFPDDQKLENCHLWRLETRIPHADSGSCRTLPLMKRTLPDGYTLYQGDWSNWPQLTWLSDSVGKPLDPPTSLPARSLVLVVTN
jgi:hypothetical protein